MKQLLKKLSFLSSAVMLLLSFIYLFAPMPVSADAPPGYCASYGGSTQSACAVGYNGGAAFKKGDKNKDLNKVCGTGAYSGDDLSICVQAWGYASGVDPATKCSDSSQCDLIGQYVNPLIEVLSVSFGLIATISIILGAIQYTTSEGDPQKSAAAKNRITNTVIAIVAFLVLYAFVEFLIPGGIFNRPTCYTGYHWDSKQNQCVAG